MRILIVGAGIGGMTLAALLDRRGVATTLVESAPNFDHAGYMLGLWPLGYRVLHGLSLYERFAAECIEGKHYEVRELSLHNRMHLGSKKRRAYFLGIQKYVQLDETNFFQ
jgi:2-polyprenyl-6-methoxyphenol hydroxylase-like FAD-dependent oxidoreductase